MTKSLLKISNVVQNWNPKRWINQMSLCDPLIYFELRSIGVQKSELFT